MKKKVWNPFGGSFKNVILTTNSRRAMEEVSETLGFPKGTLQTWTATTPKATSPPTLCLMTFGRDMEVPFELIIRPGDGGLSWKKTHKSSFLAEVSLLNFWCGTRQLLPWELLWRSTLYHNFTSKNQFHNVMQSIV